MRLISLNTWAGKMYDKLESFIKREAERTDIFCFQEILENAFLTKEQIAAKKAYAGVGQEDVMDLGLRIEKILPSFDKFISKPYTSSGDRLAIFSKRTLGIKEVSEHLLVGPINLTYNNTQLTVSSLAQCATTPDGIAVINTHGLWFYGAKTDTPDRITQSKSLISIMHSLPVTKKILIGDFNLLPDTESIKMLDGEMRNLIKEYKITTTRSNFARKNKGLFADYAFISKDVDLVEFEVLDEEVSDHLALSLEIR